MIAVRHLYCSVVHYSLAELYCIVLWPSPAARSDMTGESNREPVNGQDHERLDQRISRRADLQRLAAGDARGGDGLRSGVPDRRPARRSPALLGLLLLLVFRADAARRAAICCPLVIVALGVVVGFPLLTALALQHITSAHSIVFIGLLPLATAIFGVLRGGERPRPAFWLFSCIGSALVAGFALTQGVDRVAGRRRADARRHRRLRPGLCRGRDAVAQARRLAGDLLGAGAVAADHAGARLRRRCRRPLPASARRAWIGLAYVSLFSMLIGFVFWYRGLALGGIAAVGQLQLLQPFFGLRAGGDCCCTNRSAR